jgi:hypothetical protein
MVKVAVDKHTVVGKAGELCPEKKIIKKIVKGIHKDKCMFYTLD